MTKVIISGGGTGGHVFPAIALARALREADPDIDILFVGARGRMEMDRVPAAGFRIKGLTISGFQRRLTWKNLMFPFKLVLSMGQAFSVIRNFRPDLVIGVGGYASGPVLRVATSLHIPSIIQEQNSYPGVTNRILAPKVQKIFVAFEGMERYFPQEKTVLAGNPVREEVAASAGLKPEALDFFHLHPERRTILVIGGSLGAGTINKAILEFIAKYTLSGPSIQLIWQTGKYYFESIIEDLRASGITSMPVDQAAETVSGKWARRYEPDGLTAGAYAVTIDKPLIPFPFVVMPFIERMDLAFAAADLIISRAGAIAIAELCLVGKPAILVPSPNVAEDHQTKNAMALVSAEAAILVRDGEAVASLGPAIMNILNDATLCSTLSRNISSMARRGAAGKIAKLSLALIGRDIPEPKEPTDQTAKPGSHGSGLPEKLPGNIYFLGIGGIGMSALARYFAIRGSVVSGYDRTRTPLTRQLEAEGMRIVYEEHKQDIPNNIDLAVYTPAVPADHPAYQHFRGRNVPMMKRAEVLGLISSKYPTIAVAGTHGKTTTSTLIAHIFHSAGIDHLAFLGGISKNYGTNFLAGIHVESPGKLQEPSGVMVPGQGMEKHTAASQRLSSDPLADAPACIVEADEFDRSFLQLNPTIAIITSTDADHLDIYGNHEDLKENFSLFAGKIRPGGYLVAKLGTAVNPGPSPEYSAYHYSLDGATDFHTSGIRIEDNHFHFDFVHPGGLIRDLTLGVPGRFNLENAVAALAACLLAGLDESALRRALASYHGVQRRFDIRVNTADHLYIDDYAHHPEELRACISAVKEFYPGRRITGIFQPHLFSRTRDFATEFGQSLSMLDELWLLDIYPAREKPIPGVTSRMLLDLVTTKKKLITKEAVLDELALSKPEILLTLGAGDIDQLVEPIRKFLTK